MGRPRLLDQVSKQVCVCVEDILDLTKWEFMQADMIVNSKDTEFIGLAPFRRVEVKLEVNLLCHFLSVSA